MSFFKALFQTWQGNTANQETVKNLQEKRMKELALKQ